MYIPAYSAPVHSFLCTLHVRVHEKKSGGPEQKGILWTAVSSLLALISVVQHNLLSCFELVGSHQCNLLWDPRGFIYPTFSSVVVRN